jgi:RNA polymerase sigma-70 factor (ECF subfamily)
MLHDDTAALDVVQDTFIAAVRHIGSLRQDTRFSSWLFGIAHQRCIQWWRRQRRDAALFTTGPNEANPDAPEPDSPNPLSVLLQRERADAFFAALATLPPPHRSALLLHVLEDFSLQEIATIAGVPVGTVKSRLFHARRALRHIWEDQT